MLALFFSLFSALVLDPVVGLVQRKLNLGRGVSATIVLGIVALTIVFLFILVSPLVSALGDFVDDLPSIVQDIHVVVRLMARPAQPGS